MKKFLAVLLFLSMSSVSYAWFVSPILKPVPQNKFFQLENKSRVKHPVLNNKYKNKIRMSFNTCV